MGLHYAVFWSTVPVDRLAITGQLLTAIGFKEEAIALDHIMEWANMCSLSTIKKSNFKMPIKRKGFYIAIIEVVFIINGQDVADVEGEQDGEASVVVVWRRSRPREVLHWRVQKVPRDKITLQGG